MYETKTALKHLFVYYLLLLISIIFTSIIKDVFPIRNISTIYLLVLSVYLVLYYSHHVLPNYDLSLVIKLLSVMGLVLILLRGIKYSAVAGVGVLARHCWYLYYIPILLIPLFLLYIALLVSTKNKKRDLKIWYVTLVITVILIVLLLTNDLHQLIFKFNANFENWDSDYSRGLLFYAIYFWQFVVYLSAIIILVFKCRVSTSKKNAWIIILPAVIGIILYILLLTENMPKINGTHIMEFPEVQIFTVVTLFECCMQIGLIPTNTNYGKIFNNMSIPTQITDTQGNVIYSSQKASVLTKQQFCSESGSRISEHTILYKMEISGGFGFWQYDMSEIDRLNSELTDAKEYLKQEVELVKLKNELKEKRTKLRERTLVYDLIAKSTQKQSQQISLLSKMAKESNELSVKEDCKRKITRLGAYIKRYANLMLLSQEKNEIEAGELGLSISEVLRYLNLCGIPGEFVGNADCTIPSSSALVVFEVFESLIEMNYNDLSGVTVNLSKKENVELKIIFEDLKNSILENEKEKLLSSNVLLNIEKEDNITYICFIIKGGDKL